MAGRLLGVYVTSAIVACALVAPALAGDPFLERAKRQSEQGKPADTAPSDDASRPRASADKTKPVQPPGSEEQQKKDQQRLEQIQKSIARALAEAEKLINEGKHHDAYPLLDECRKRLGRLTDPATQALLARVALAEEEPRRALKFLSEVPPEGSVLDPPNAETEALFELFGCYHAAGQAYLQLAGLDEGKARQSPANDEEDGESRARRNSPDRDAKQAQVAQATRATATLSFFGITIDPASGKPLLDDEAKKHADAALVLFDWLASKTDGFQQLLAAEGCAKALVLLGRYQDAIGAYEFAIHNARVQASHESAEMPQHLRDLLNRLTSGLNTVRRLRDIELYSHEYVLFREAEILRREKKQYARAIEKYDATIAAAEKTMADLAKQETERQLLQREQQEKNGTFFGVPTGEAVSDQPSAISPRPRKLDNRQSSIDASEGRQSQESPFSAAARFYRCLCLIEIGDKDSLAKAARDLQRFIDTDPGTKAILKAAKKQQKSDVSGQPHAFPLPLGEGRGEGAPAESQPHIEPGLYRGEALLELGRLALEQELDLARAEKYFRGLDAWIAAVRNEEQAWDFARLLPGIRAAAKKRTDGPAHEKFTDFWGNVDKARIEPGQLVNRKTTAWYLDDLEEQAAKSRGLVLFVQGHSKEALQQWSRIIELDVSNRASDFEATDFRRLTFSVENGHLLAFSEELSLYDKHHRIAVLVADFRYTCGDFEKALALYKDILAERLGRLTSPQRDFLQFAVGLCYMRLKNMTDAVEHWKGVLKYADETFTEYRAAYAIAHLSRYSSDKVFRAYGDELLRQLSASSINNEFTRNSRLIVAMEAADRGEHIKAMRLLRQIDDSSQAATAIAQYLIRNEGKVVLPPIAPPQAKKKGASQHESIPLTNQPTEGTPSTEDSKNDQPRTDDGSSSEGGNDGDDHAPRFFGVNADD